MSDVNQTADQTGQLSPIVDENGVPVQSPTSEPAVVNTDLTADPAASVVVPLAPQVATAPSDTLDSLLGEPNWDAGVGLDTAPGTAMDNSVEPIPDPAASVQQPDPEPEPDEISVAALIIPELVGPLGEIKAWLHLIPASQATQGITASVKKMEAAFEDLPTIRGTIV
jgi:hypothetical protein